MPSSVFKKLTLSFCSYSFVTSFCGSGIKIQNKAAFRAMLLKPFRVPSSLTNREKGTFSDNGQGHFLIVDLQIYHI